MQIDGPFKGIITKQVVFLSALCMLVITSALAIVFTKHNTRTSHATLQKLGNKRDALQIEWSKLVLEQSTWTADSRVEKVARHKLNMEIPDKTIVIRP
jgi:cell division protein FtsL